MLVVVDDKVLDSTDQAMTRADSPPSAQWGLKAPGSSRRTSSRGAPAKSRHSYLDGSASQESSFGALLVNPKVVQFTGPSISRRAVVVRNRGGTSMFPSPARKLLSSLRLEIELFKLILTAHLAAPLLLPLYKLHLITNAWNPRIEVFLKSQQCSAFHLC